MQKGNLYLIPNTLGNDNVSMVIPAGVTEIINSTDFYIVENIQTAAKFLKLAGLKKPLRRLTFYVLNVNTTEAEVSSYLDEADNGNNTGLISEAGLPCIADPGNVIVKMAHAKGIRVIPLSGPSSITLALMASGFNGQNFAFNGYLPIEKTNRIRKLKELENKVKSGNQAQIFIEAPHRNDRLLDDIIKNCSGDIMLCIAKELTGENEEIIVKPISSWREEKITLGKVPVIFILGN